jgi:LAO/AO transport system kinase
MLKLGHPTKKLMHHGKAITMDAADSELAATDDWIPPIRRTVASDGKGIAELAEAIAGHRLHLEKTGDWQRRDRARLQTEVEALLQTNLMNRWREKTSEAKVRQTIDELMERKLSPRQAVSKLLNGAGPA